jgi:hypothetical protein
MSNKITPSLESITLRAKYFLPETNFSIVEKAIADVLLSEGWATIAKLGESIAIFKIGKEKHSILMEPQKKITSIWQKRIKNLRHGAPLYFSIMVIEHPNTGMLVEVECRPALWFKIATLKEKDFTENEIQEALIECRVFVKQVMSIFKGKEVEPVSVYPIIQKTEIKSRLLNLGLKEVVSPLDKAERHIVQKNFTESLKSSRTAFEKMIDWEMRKRGLDLTSNQRNNLDRLRSKGYLDSETTELLQSYYKCLSNIAVHERGEVEPGFYEANMGYGITLIMLDYLASKLP